MTSVLSVKSSPHQLTCQILERNGQGKTAHYFRENLGRFGGIFSGSARVTGDRNLIVLDGLLPGREDKRCRGRNGAREIVMMQ